MRGSRHNIVIPLPLDPPAPDIMDPALGLGLHNPDEDVQKMADGASAKMEHASVMRSAEAERSNAREFVRRFEPERPDEPANPAVLTNEELAAYEELIDERQLEGMAEAEEEAKERGEGEGGPAASQQKKKKKVRYPTLPHFTIRPFNTLPSPRSFFKDDS